MRGKRDARTIEETSDLCNSFLSIDINNEEDEGEVIYEEVLVSESESDGNEYSDEEVEYIYEIQYIEEDEEEKQKDEEKSLPKQSEVLQSSSTLRKSYKQEEVLPPSILLHSPPSFKKSVSFSSVHSVLTENNDIIYVDEEDDIFS